MAAVCVNKSAFSYTYKRFARWTDQFDDFGTWERHSNRAIVSSYEDIYGICTLRIPFWYLGGTLIMQPYRIMKIYILTESIPVLRRRFRYYGIDSGTTKSTFRYCKGNCGTTVSMPVLQSRFRYYGVDSGTTESIPVLRSRFQ